MSYKVGLSRYSQDRETAKAINALAVRAQFYDATISSTPLGHRYAIDRWSAKAIDKIATAISTADSKFPKKIFGVNFSYNRGINKLITDFEARLTALGH